METFRLSLTEFQEYVSVSRFQRSYWVNRCSLQGRNEKSNKYLISVVTFCVVNNETFSSTVLKFREIEISKLCVTAQGALTERFRMIPLLHTNGRD